MPCARLSWPFRQLSSARKYIVSYRINGIPDATVTDTNQFGQFRSIDYKLAVLTYKARQNGSPSYLASLISDYAPSRSLRSSDKQLLSRPYTSLVMADKAFSVSAPNIWNDLSFNCCAAICIHTPCLKKRPTFKLSLTLSNLNRLSKFLNCWKAYEICYKSHMTIPTLP